MKKTDMHQKKKSSSRALAAALAALIALALALSACSGDKPDDPGEPGVVDILPGVTEQNVPPPTPVPTPAPTPEPATVEGRILAGLIYPLCEGVVTGADFPGESIDVDGDGVPETLDVRDIDGGPVFCVDGKPFMDIGTSISLVSLDGENILFLSEKHGRDGFHLFYPDEDGNLFCRLFGFARTGGSEDFTIRPSYEEYVKNGLEIMLHNPMLYSSVSGDSRSLSIDMNGDGERERITFDAETLSVNGLENKPILSTTMPRFIYDKAHDAIVLSGSAGDYALSLRYDGSTLNEDISYASLL